MKKLLISLTCAAFAVAIFAAHAIRQRKEIAVTPAAEFALSPEEIHKLATKAEEGDCAAAYRIGKHFSSVTLDFEKAVRWFRLAAKCPGVSAKEELVVLLKSYEDTPGVTAEIDELITQIQNVDPNAAKRAQADLDETRNEHNRSKKNQGRRD